MKKMKLFTTIFLGLTVLFGACEKLDLPKGTPSCIKKKISEDADKCIDKVYEYTYKGEKIYRFVGCSGKDTTGIFYDDDCNRTCHVSPPFVPDGMPSCYQVLNNAANEKIIYSK